MELTLTTRTDPEREFFAVAVRSGRSNFTDTVVAA
jgi:hypothetical protein